MSRKRKDLRRRRQHDETTLPACPGALPDSSPESLARAMREAHEILPYVPGTRVEVCTYEREAGLALVREYFGGEPAVAQVRELLDGFGPAAVVTICARRFRSDLHNHHRPAAT